MASGVAVDKTKHVAILAPGSGGSISVLGDHQTVKLTGEQTNGLFTMVEQNNEASVAVPMHVHTREDELFYVCKGEITLFLDGKEIVGSTGMTVYLPRGVPHGFRVNKKNQIADQCVPCRREHVLQIGRFAARPPDFEKVKAICAEYGIYFS
jgi:quercetin dioxygenase-like cupin family protein